MRTKRKKAKKNPNKKIKKEIQKAVEKIPGLIFEQTKLKSTAYEHLSVEEESETTIHPAIAVPAQNYADQKIKRRIMWLIVGIFGAVIIILWAFNIQRIFYDIKIKENKNILQTAKDDFQKIMSTMGEKTQIEKERKLKEVIKKSLNEIFSAKTTSTTASSTDLYLKQ